MVKAGDGADGAADVVGLDGLIEVYDGWVFGVAAEDFFGFFFSVALD